MPLSEPLEPSDDELKAIESEEQAESTHLNINGGFALYGLQTERIELLAGIVQTFARKECLDHIRQIVEDELKLLLADQQPLNIALLAGARSAREGVSLES